MTDFPRSLLEVQRRFPDDARLRGLPGGGAVVGGFVCPECGGPRACLLVTKKHTYQCSACHRQTAVTAGTVMHGSKLSLTVWFWAAYLMATHSNGISARQLWRQLGLGSYKSAWLLCAKLRRAMVDPARDPLSGLVEVDETQIAYRTRDDPPVGGGRRGAGKLQVAAAVEVEGKGPGPRSPGGDQGRLGHHPARLPHSQRRPRRHPQDRRLVRLPWRAGRHPRPARRRPHGRAYRPALGAPHLLQPQDLGPGRLSRAATGSSPGIPRRIRLQVQPATHAARGVSHAARHRRRPQTHNLQDADLGGSKGISVQIVSA